MSYPGWFEQMERDELQDADYREAVREEREEKQIVRELCSLCQGIGKCYMADGTPFPPLVACACCAGSGLVLTEVQA